MRARSGVDRSDMEAVAGVPGRGPIQAKRELAVGRGELVGPAAAPAGDVAAAPGRPLPGAVRGRMEAAFGADFSSVQVHEDGQAAGLGAAAFARGEHLHFQPGRFDPASTGGQELIGHELAHVVQQRAGRVAAPMGKGGVNTDPALEAEADQMGARAARGEPTGGATAATHAATQAATDGPAQLQTTLGRARVAEMRPGQQGGWRWVSGGDPHITIFLDIASRDRLWTEINEGRIGRTGENGLKMTDVPQNFALTYDEFHVTIGQTHYYYDDQGTPMASNREGFGLSPAFNQAGWAAANRVAGPFLGVDPYALNVRVNQLGGHLPISAQDAQNKANAQQNFGKNAMQSHLRRLQLAKQSRGGGTVGGLGRGGGAPVKTSTERTEPVEKRKLEDSAPTREETEAENKAETENDNEVLLEETCRGSTKHQKTEHDDEDGSGGSGGKDTGNLTGITTTTNQEISVL